MNKFQSNEQKDLLGKLLLLLLLLDELEGLVEGLLDLLDILDNGRAVDAR